MEELAAEYSLLDELGLHNLYEIVARKNGQLVYAHTVYYQLLESDYEDFITEDDEPMDNLLSEKILRLLVEVLQALEKNWTDRDFMACANVSIYYKKGKYIVPDMFLSLDVKHPKDWRDKKDKCYIAWEMGKMPELALEVVSNKIGGEDTEKKKLYAELGIKYYIIYDPYNYLSDKELRVYELKANDKYALVQRKHNFMPAVNLGIKLWTGLYEGEGDTWARWCNKKGVFLKTGSEQAEIERAEKEKERAEKEKERTEKEKERERAEREKAEKEKERERAEKEKQRADEAEELLLQLQAQLEALKLNQE